MLILDHRFQSSIDKPDNNCDIKIGREITDSYDIIVDGYFNVRERKNVYIDFISWIQFNDNSYKLTFYLKDQTYYNYGKRKSYIFCKVEIEESALLDKLKNDKLNDVEVKYFRSMFTKAISYDKIKTLWKEKWTPNIEITNQPKHIITKLFKYQLESLNWMIKIEQSNNKFKLDNKRKFSEILPESKELDGYFMNMFTDEINVNNTNYFKTNGGILADEMGLGKTLTTISLISEKPYIYNPNRVDQDFQFEIKKFKNIEYLVTKATLIICPSHLTKQWSNEIKDNCPSLKQICILTKTNHDKYTLEDVINSDVVITSFQFISNVNYYINYLHKIDSSNRRYTNSMLYGKNILDRHSDILNLNNNRYNKNLIKCNDILFESIFWNRVIIDEAHEIFKHNYSYSSSNDVSSFELHFLKNLKCNTKWYISGTPFFDKDSLLNVMDFLDFETQLKIGNLEYKVKLQDSLSYGLSEMNLLNSILSQIYIRNTKESVKDQLEIPTSTFENIYLELTDFERNIYRSYETHSSGSFLRKICCNIQICDKFSNGDSSQVLNFDEVKDQLIKDNEKKITSTKLSIEALDENIPGYAARKKMLENIINSCNFFLNCINIDKFKINEESCPICKCEFEDPIITKCGHHFCHECIKEVLLLSSNKKECPICRADLKNSNMFRLNSEPKDDSDIDELVFKYGTKLAKLIRLCNQILLNKENKIIIFSEWDKLLSMIGTVLTNNEIPNIFCKGNVHQRNNSISRFRKKDGEDRIIMLSTENAASGTNLTEATHIIFMEPHVGNYGAVKAIEDQAVGRAERLGQQNQVKVYRLITKNTIEEKIFNEFLSNKEKIGEDEENNQILSVDI